MGLEFLVFIVALLCAVPAIYRRARHAPDVEWEKRWNALPRVEQERIAAAVRKGDPLYSHEETELALVFAYEQRKTVELLTRPSLAHFVLGATLLIELHFGDPLLVFALTFLVLAYFIWLAYRDRVTKRNLARLEELSGVV